MTLTRAFQWSGGSESLTIQGATENGKKEAKTSSTVQVTFVRHLLIKESREMGQELEGQARRDVRNKFMLVCQWERKTEKR